MSTRAKAHPHLPPDRLGNRRPDTYRWKRKPPGTTVCPRCDAVFREGVWRWEPAPEGVHEHPCPACLRIEDHYPAGFVVLGGAFLEAHRDEIVHLARNEEAAEKAEHPLERIIAVETGPGRAEITTTGVHVARRIADAVHRAYGGELDSHHEADDQLLRLRWSRET